MPFGWFRRRSREARIQPEMGGHRFFFLSGRRYVADAPYMLPKDDGETNRLDFQHYMLRYVLRGNYGVPLTEPRDILDVGCGTGRWPIEMARQFPQANVIGLDIVPPQVDNTPRPDNCVFVTGNVLEGLPFPDASFDFVHQRLLLGAIPAQRWPDVVAELLRVTRPGGWIELIEPAPAPGGGPALSALREWMREATARRGMDAYIGTQIGTFLESAGLRNVTFHELNIPMGQAGGRLGVMAETNYMSLFTSLRGLILAQNITTPDHFDQVMATARQEVSIGRYTSPYYLAFGQRPR